MLHIILWRRCIDLRLYRNVFSMYISIKTQRVEGILAIKTEVFGYYY